MSKYGHRSHNWFEAIVNKLGGENAAERFLRGELVVTEPERGEGEKILKLIQNSLMLDKLNGSEILADAKDVFAYIDSDFKNWKADEMGVATEETAVDVYEMTKDATYVQMFGSLSTDLNKLCLTQAQIKNFVVKHRQYLRMDGYATFFLFKSNNHFFVAYVYFNDADKLAVGVSRLGYGNVWRADFRLRFVVPQLADAQ